MAEETSGWTERSDIELSTPAGALQDIIKAYQDPMTKGWPWIVAVSFGKDSSLVLKMVILALRQLPKEERYRPVHVITSDIGVEVPPVLHHVRSNVADLARFVKQ
ncbi:MAG: hypothetical protein ACYCX4_00050 [Bacillota bacterium]